MDESDKPEISKSRLKEVLCEFEVLKERYGLN